MIDNSFQPSCNTVHIHHIQQQINNNHNAQNYEYKTIVYALTNWQQWKPN